MDMNIRMPGTRVLERRFRAVRLDPWDVLQALRGHGPAALLAFEDLPEDATVVSLHAEEVPCSFVVVLYHPSWDVVPDGEWPPSLRLRRVEVSGEPARPVTRGPDPCHVVAP
jgi:hypothetical protein